MSAPMDLDELIENFTFFDEWTDRYRYLIDLGRQLEPLEEEARTEENKVRGCQSQVWLVVVEGAGAGAMVFHADSDSAIVKGLIAIILAVYSGRTPEEIVKADIEGVFREIGLDNHLSPNRRNGFFSMVARIKALAAQQLAASGV